MIILENNFRKNNVVVGVRQLELFGIELRNVGRHGVATPGLVGLDHFIGGTESDHFIAHGIGSKVTTYHHGQIQFMEHFLNRGYESTVDGVLHIGLDTTRVIDSLEVIWPDGHYQLLKKVKANQLLTLKYTSAAPGIRSQNKPVGTLLFTEVSKERGINYTHQENDYVDFKVQPLLPHMHSKNGPGIAVADVNGDGLDDFYAIRKNLCDLKKDMVSLQ